MLNRGVLIALALLASDVAFGGPPGTGLVRIEPIHRKDGMYVQLANLSKQVVTIDYLSIDMPPKNPLVKMCYTSLRPGDLRPGQVKVMRVATRSSLKNCLPSWQVQTVPPEEVTRTNPVIVQSYLLLLTSVAQKPATTTATWNFAPVAR
ncbi:MAG TPA: hypothetical protein VKB41_00700 [Steroidobacteraceae bacterium]|jgi:hypothetical protein|nr:hypothetical protein [Steroidobacteraceae bacterium]